MESQAKYALLAAGEGDLMLRLLSVDQPDYREKIWDQAAGAIILEEAGGKITDLDGCALDFTTGKTLSKNNILVGTVSVIALYVVANLAYLYVLPVGKIAASEGRVALDVMEMVSGPFGASLITFLILFSILGAANQNILCSPRVYFAMARNGLFFKKIAEYHPRYLTPYVSIIAISVWSILLTLTGTFRQLFTYVIFGEWVFFGLTVAAVIVLRKKRPDLERPYKTWGYPVTPAIFILAALYIAVASLLSAFWNALAGLGIICLGIPANLYWKSKLDRKSKPAT